MYIYNLARISSGLILLVPESYPRLQPSPTKAAFNIFPKAPQEGAPCKPEMYLVFSGLKLGFKHLFRLLENRVVVARRIERGPKRAKRIKKCKLPVIK